MDFSFLQNNPIVAILAGLTVVIPFYFRLRADIQKSKIEDVNSNAEFKFRIDFMKEFEEQKKEIKTLQTANIELNNTVSELRADIKIFNSKFEILNNDMESLKKSLEDSIERNDFLEREINSLREQNDMLVKEINEKNEIIHDLEEKVNRYRHNRSRIKNADTQ